MNCPYTIDQIFTVAVNAFLLGATFMAILWFVIWWRNDNAKMKHEEQKLREGFDKALLPLKRPPEKNVPRGGKAT